MPCYQIKVVLRGIGAKVSKNKTGKRKDKTKMVIERAEFIDRRLKLHKEEKRLYSSMKSRTDKDKRKRFKEEGRQGKDNDERVKCIGRRQKLYMEEKEILKSR